MYKVVSCTNKESFEATLDSYLSKGWKLLGSLVVSIESDSRSTRPIYCQSLTKGV